MKEYRKLTSVKHSPQIKFFAKLFLGCVIFYTLVIFYIGDKTEWNVLTLTKEKIFVPSLSSEVLEIHRRLKLSNPGYMGLPVNLTLDLLPEDIKAEIDESNEKFKFNEFVSRLIPLDRKLPDYRTVECRSAVYAENLPKVSIILSFYNEPFTMVMRTIYSILKRSPLELIEEIILLDDCSDDQILLKALHEIVAKLPKVRIFRSPTRLGLMRARILGSVNAKGPVLIIMDSHIEVVDGWLPPLLDPIARNRKTITLPAVEMLHPQTLEYVNVVKGLYNYVGGFTWELMYTWVFTKMPNRTDIPLKSPTMVGSAFAIRKDYFEELGYYDTGFELWGGENLELSFKVWMCGGQMLQAFCSHIGHMFRSRPYWDDQSDFKMRRNTDRLAEVWLDDYKQYYHRHTKFHSRVNEFGDVSEQKALRTRLGCKSFQWFIDNIYPIPLTLN